MNNNINDCEIAKHKKKSNYKGEKRADHKHIYNNALGYINNNLFTDKYFRISYCTICGKIKDKHMLETESVPGKSYVKVLTSKEIYKKYKNKLEIFEINDIIDKYVILKENI